MLLKTRCFTIFLATLPWSAPAFQRLQYARQRRWAANEKLLSARMPNDENLPVEPRWTGRLARPAGRSNPSPAQPVLRRPTSGQEYPCVLGQPFVVRQNRQPLATAVRTSRSVGRRQSHIRRIAGALHASSSPKREIRKPADHCLGRRRHGQPSNHWVAARQPIAPVAVSVVCGRLCPATPCRLAVE